MWKFAATKRIERARKRDCLAGIPKSTHTIESQSGIFKQQVGKQVNPPLDEMGVKQTY